jgi:hypothetical protein
MKGLLKNKLLILLLAFIFTLSAAEAQPNKRYVKNPEKELFGKSLNKKNVKVKEPRSVVRAKKKQAESAKKIDKQYAKYVERNREHAIKIQSPEVQTRMKENRKESENNYAIKKKKTGKNSKKASKKYGR